MVLHVLLVEPTESWLAVASRLCDMAQQLIGCGQQVVWHGTTVDWLWPTGCVTWHNSWLTVAYRLCDMAQQLIGCGQQVVWHGTTVDWLWPTGCVTWHNSWLAVASRLCDMAQQLIGCGLQVVWHGTTVDWLWPAGCVTWHNSWLTVAYRLCDIAQQCDCHAVSSWTTLTCILLFSWAGLARWVVCWACSPAWCSVVDLAIRWASGRGDFSSTQIGQCCKIQSPPSQLWKEGGRGQNSSISSLLGSLSCVIQRLWVWSSSELLVEGISPLGLTWVLTPFPKTLLVESIYRGLVCAHMQSVAHTWKILTFMS